MDFEADKNPRPSRRSRSAGLPRTAVGYEELPVPAQCDFGGFVGAVLAPAVPFAIDTCGRKGSVAATTLPTFINLACLICALLSPCSGPAANSGGTTRQIERSPRPVIGGDRARSFSNVREQ